MKIKETIERECCQQGKDLKPYQGLKFSDTIVKISFCIHCGQLWFLTSQMDAAGGTESILKKVTI